jgi:hypothetical protein
MVEFGKIYKCQLNRPVIGKKPTKTRVKEKSINANNSIELMAINVSTMPSGHMLAFQTKDGYMIPDLNVIPIMEIGDSRTSYEEAQVIKEVSNKKSINKSDVNLTKGYGLNSKLAVNFALAGGAFMLYKAYKTGQSKILLTAIGLAGGGFVGMQFSKFKKK